MGCYDLSLIDLGFKVLYTTVLINSIICVAVLFYVHFDDPLELLRHLRFFAPPTFGTAIALVLNEILGTRELSEAELIRRLNEIQAARGQGGQDTKGLTERDT